MPLQLLATLLKVNEVMTLKRLLHKKIGYKNAIQCNAIEVLACISFQNIYKNVDLKSEHHKEILPAA